MWLKNKCQRPGTDTNVVTLFLKEGMIELPKKSKKEVAADIFDVILNMISA